MGFTLPSFWRATTPPTTARLNEQRALDATATLELEGAQAPQSKAITSGSISPTAAYVIVDTEGSAAADDLSVISPVLSASENLHDGMVLYLKAADSGRVVTVKNSSSANGINTYDGNDYVLSTTHWLKLQLRSGEWYEVEGRAMETALAAATAAAAASTPATTTARGIARVATLADMEPGVVVEKGPAFPDVQGGVITTTPTAHAVPQADASGDVWGLAKQDLSNLNATGKAAITAMASPSNRYIDISLPSPGGTYKAPANGWLTFVGTANLAGTYLQLVCGKRSTIMIAYAPVSPMSVEMKVQKNQVVTVNYNFSGYSLLTFTYDEGN